MLTVDCDDYDYYDYYEEDYSVRSEQCHWGLCVSNNSLCDGFNDCYDWSDEVACSGTQSSLDVSLQNNHLQSIPFLIVF